MNITFLIGNGFDVGVGMKSSFRDFFPIYQQNSINKPDEIRQLSEEIGNDYNTWADFEVALGKYTTKFDAETKDIFILQLKDFEKEFVEYLQEREKKIEYNEEVESVMKNALTQFYDTKKLAFESSETIKKVFTAYNGYGHKYNFINFNYTDALRNCLNTISQKVVCRRGSSPNEKIDRVGEIVHVHGKIDLHPIIGLNDVEQIANKELAKDEEFVKFVIKPSLTRLLRQGNDVNASRLINESKIICLYGMSLGVTDKKWWEMIVKWLAASGEHQLVIFDYDDKYTTYTQFDWLEKEDLIIRKLSQYTSSMKIDVNALRPRIHVAVHKNIFAMDLVTK